MNETTNQSAEVQGPTVAQRILNQMGGVDHLTILVNAREIQEGDDGVAFRFSGFPKANRCQVAASGDSAYHFALIKDAERAAAPGRTFFEIDGVGGDALSRIFEQKTGLHLTIAGK